MYGDSLLDYLNKTGAMSEENARVIMRRLLKAIKIMHDRGITHRDIKIDNLMFQHVNNLLESICFIDFGTSRFMGMNHMASSCEGTSIYSCPQTVNNYQENPYDSTKADVWTLGSVLFIL